MTTEIGPAGGPDDFDRAERRHLIRNVLAIGALVLFIAVMLVVIAALTFSVQVNGNSMEPTLASEDRLLVDPLSTDSVERFDLLEVTQPGAPEHGGGKEIVKRVIGLPGDEVRVLGDREEPTVLLRPAGEEATYRVEHPAWAERMAGGIEACCTPDGANTRDGAAWSTVPEDNYWLIGDNWARTMDSREFGYVPAGNVQAELWFRILPLGDFGRVPNEAELALRR